MAIGAFVAGGRALAKKAGKRKAPKQGSTAAKRASVLDKIDARTRSATTVAQDLNRGIKEFKADAAAATRSSDRRIARQATGATAAAVAGGAAGSRKAKTKPADPVASRSRTNLQRGR